MKRTGRTHLLFRPGALGDALLTVPLVTRILEAHPDDTLVWYQSPWTCELPWSKILPATVQGRLRIESFESPEASAWLNLNLATPDDQAPSMAGIGTVLMITASIPTGNSDWFYAAGYYDHFDWIPAPTGQIQTQPHAAERLCRAPNPAENRPASDPVRTAAVRAPIDLRATWLCNPLDLANRQGNLCMLQPGAGSRRKQLPIQHWLDLAAQQRAQGMTVQWLLGPAEIERGLPQQIRQTNPTADLATPTLAGLPAVLGRAGRFFGHDSGPSHLAGMLGIETHVFFGPTNPDVWGPLGPKVVIHPFDPKAAIDPTPGAAPDLHG